MIPYMYTLFIWNVKDIIFIWSFFKVLNQVLYIWFRCHWDTLGVLYPRHI